MADNRVIVVLGMHHSGTSVIARSLAVFNVYLGDDLMPSQPDHPTGFWEDNQITATNDRILAARNFSWRKLGFDCALMKKHPAYRQTVKQIAHDVRSRFSHAPLWGFKDPRTCRLLPFWKDVFISTGIKPSYIIVVRHPRSVAESLRSKYGMSMHLGYALWLEHMTAAIHDTRRDNRVFISYDRMMDDPKRELRRQAVALDLDLSKLRSKSARTFIQSFLDPKLRHRRYDQHPLPPETRGHNIYQAAFSLLDAATADAMSQSAFRRAWKALLEK